METDEPTQPYSAYVPRKEGGGENSFAVPPKMSQGPGPSAPVFSASSVRGPRMSTGTNATPASINNFSFSASNRAVGQTMSVPSTQAVLSIGAQTQLPDMGNMEEIDMEMAPVQVAGKCPVLTRTES